jgi:CDP-6-deoxy-D-xylo-4-hexulose-3-dehydrase
MTSKIYYAPHTFQSFGEAEMIAVQSFLRDHPLLENSPIEAFEGKVAQLFGMKHGIFVNSGSSANLLSCLALGLGPNDEVITPACTFATTLSPLVLFKCKVRFCDVDARRYVPSVSQIIELITDSTTVVLMPDVVGDRFDFASLRDELRKAGREDIRLIEDSCDTVVKSVADVVTVSFYASHIISAGGMGGMVMTNCDTLAERCRQLRCSGAWDFSAPAFCAVFGLVNAEKFEEWAAIRKRNFYRYCEKLKDCSFYELPSFGDCVWLSMPLICQSNRYEIVQELEAKQIQTRLCLSGNILRQPYYQNMYKDVDVEGLRQTERIFRGGILLGLHQGVTNEQIDFVCDELKKLAEKFGNY